MKWKLLLRKLSISSPEVSVRSHLPLPVRLLLLFLVLALAAAAGVGIYEYGRGFGRPDRRELLAQIERLESKLRETEAERSRLTATVTALEAQMKVERAAQEQLAKQADELETEANRLRDDLAFFESLLPTKASASGIQIRSFRMQPDGTPEAMRYRLLVQQAGKPERDFVGVVQMQVNYVAEGRPHSLQVPDPAVPDSRRPLELSFRHYQRVEGTITLPEGATAKSVVVRIVAAGQTHAQQTFQL
jgi:multidrug efflux pump subunit AcrA (membrane-fusion protein)